MTSYQFVIFMIFSTVAYNGFSQKVTSIDDAKKMLAKTNKVTSARAGEMADHPVEILAFNFLYFSKTPSKHFKELFKQSKSAGKFYALVGLHMLKDKDFDMLKKRFDAAPQDNVDVLYGCKGANDVDIKRELDVWLKGMPKKLWYTNIIINN